MDRILNNLEPERVFYYFEELSRIPHGSGDTKAVSDYCVRFAEDRGLLCRQDALHNVIIIKEASEGYENASAVMLQGHLDMVNEKESGTEHDFSRDPLKLKVVISDYNESDMRYMRLHELQHNNHKDAVASYLMNLAGVISVSYTHLDVYKRQVMARSGFCIFVR